MKTIAIVGCGWLGFPLAQTLKAKGWQVRGSTRNHETLLKLSNLGIQPHLLSVSQQVECDAPELLFAESTLVINVPPGRQQQTNRYGDRIDLLACLAKRCGSKNVIFVSSTSVYGHGDTVDEQSAIDSTDRAQAMRAAEQAVEDVFGKQLTVLRLDGLVGDQRHPGRFLAGKNDLAGKNAPVNLVHRDDVINAIQLIIEHDRFERCYNLVAPAHPTRGEFYCKMAQRLSLQPPTFSETPVLVKRVIGEQICTELGFVYRHPDPMHMPFNVA